MCPAGLAWRELYMDLFVLHSIPKGLTNKQHIANWKMKTAGEQ